MPSAGPYREGDQGALAQSTADTTGPVKMPKVPSSFVCGLLLAVVKVALRAAGLRRVVCLIRKRTLSQAKHARAHTTEEVAEVEGVVAFAGALFPGRALCLEQSLVLWYLLRRRGVDASFALGVQAYPFGAHAWVEHGGRPLNDVPEHVAHFTRLPDVLG